MSGCTLSYHPIQGWSQTFPDLDSEQTLVLVFGPATAHENLQPFAELAAAFPRSHILGCSTSGAILGPNVSEEGLVVAVHRFKHTTLRQASTSVCGPEDSLKSGHTLAQALTGPDLQGVFVLSDGVNVNGSQLVQGLRKVLPPSVAVTGGMAGDGASFQHTWVLQGAEPRNGILTAIGFYGNQLRFGYGSHGGWDIFGIERQVTRSEGNVVYEIDHQPALQLYKNYLGELAEGLPATALLFPLSLRVDDQHSLVRTILSVNEADQSMTFAGDIPQNHRVQLMKASAERLIDGALLSAQMAHPSNQSMTPVLSVAISCVGRQLVLNQRLEEEVEAVVDVLPKGVPLVGFYSHGEISPQGNGYCELHNQTMTVLTLREAG